MRGVGIYAYNDIQKSCSLLHSLHVLALYCVVAIKKKSEIELGISFITF